MIYKFHPHYMALHTRIPRH